MSWAFSEPPNTAAITLRRIIEAGRPILLVTHDEDDAGFQFLDFDDFTEADGCIVCLAEMVKIDPSVAGLANLPLGWVATRRTINEPWNRKPRPKEWGGV